MTATNTDQRFFALALKAANKSPHPQHKMAAVVVRGGAVVSVKSNLSTWGSHAERRALRPHMDLEGCTLYIVRNNLRCSAPCPMCRAAIQAAGIKCVIYFNKNNEIHRENF